MVMWTERRRPSALKSPFAMLTSRLLPTASKQRSCGKSEVLESIVTSPVTSLTSRIVLLPELTCRLPSILTADAHSGSTRRPPIPASPLPAAPPLEVEAPPLPLPPLPLPPLPPLPPPDEPPPGEPATMAVPPPAWVPLVVESLPWPRLDTFPHAQSREAASKTSCGR